jgi:hypothetical protein
MSQRRRRVGPRAMELLAAPGIPVTGPSPLPVASPILLRQPRYRIIGRAVDFSCWSVAPAN